MTGTKIYGASDDLIEFEGEVIGETGAGGVNGTLLVCSDGTLIVARYPKLESMAVWGLIVVNAGPLFDHKDECGDEDAEPASDVIYMKPGLAFAYAATEFERVR